MLNKIILIGRLTRDPELRYTPNGVAVCNYSLAVERPFTNREGEREVDFIRIVCWRKLAETCANQLGKGRLVAVDGRLQIRSYEDQQGQKRNAAEVVAGNVRFLDWPSDAQGRNNSGQTRDNADDPDVDADAIDINEDDVPF